MCQHFEELCCVCTKALSAAAAAAFYTLFPLSKDRVPKEYPEQNETVKEFFVLRKRIEKKTSQHTKKILFFLFLTLCFELCFYTNQFLLPITFLRVMLCIFFCCSRHERKSFLFFLQPTEESHLHNHYQQRDNTTHDRGELLYLFSMYQNHFILKIAIVKSWVWVEVNV